MEQVSPLETNAAVVSEVNPQKLRKALLALYAIIVIRVVGMVVGLGLALRAQMEFGFREMESLFSGLGFAAVWTAVLVVASVLVAKDLKRQQTWAWIAALCVFLMAAPSFCLPASIIGMLALLDEEVRTPFLKKLEVKF